MTKKATESDLQVAITRINHLIPEGVHLEKWGRKYRVETMSSRTPLGRTWLSATDLHKQLWRQVDAIELSRRG